MRYVMTVYLFVFLVCDISEAQVLPTSSGSCRISASGLESCNWLSGVTLREVATAKTDNKVTESHPKLFITRCILAPGAPLHRFVEGTDERIVGVNNGDLLNEKKTPQSHVSVSNGLAMLMPKEEPYLLRNIGKEDLEVLVIEVRK